jgi:hypothetical protein
LVFSISEPEVIGDSQDEMSVGSSADKYSTHSNHIGQALPQDFETKSIIEQRVDLLEATNNTLRKENESLKAAQRNVATTSHASQQEDEIFEQGRLIEKLISDRKDRGSFGTFTKLQDIKNLTDSVDVSKELAELQYLIKQASFPYDGEHLTKLSRLQPNEKLIQLLQKSLCPRGSREETKSWADLLSDIPPRAMIRALMTSAVALWVFDTDFPSLMPMESLLLRKYQSHLNTQGKTCKSLKRPTNL